MAFNPLHQFRKRQKTILAGVTIMCMFIFVLQFGRGDPIERFSQLLGARAPRDQVVATLYGRDVSKRDVVLLRDQRLIANQFMAAANELALRKIGTLKSNLRQPLANVQELGPVLEQAIQGGLMLPFNDNPQLRNFIQQNNDQMIGQLKTIQASLAKANKTSEAEAVSSLLALVYDEYRLRIKATTLRNRLYFGGSTTAEGLLDFLIWQNQADRLGIQLTGNVVLDLVKRDTANQFDSDIFRASVQFVRQKFGNVNRDTVISALNGEFRGGLAEIALRGPSPGSIDSNWPSPLTPYEFWQFYKKQVSKIDVDLLPVSVRSQEFLAKVGQPTEDELKALYEKYKDVEPSPTSPTPGFKHPATIRVEWVKADPAKYREQAVAAEKFVRAGQQAAAGAVAAGVALAAVPNSFDLNLIAAYDNSKWLYRLPATTDKFFAIPFYGSLERPENTTAVFGLAAAAAGAQATVLAPLNGQMAAVAGETPEVKHAIDREMATPVALKAGSLVLNGAAGPFAALAADRTWESGRGNSRNIPWIDQYVPFEVVKSRLEEKERNRQARKLANDALNRLKDALEARSKVRTPEDLRVFEELSRPEAAATAVGLLSAAAAGGSPLPAGVTVGGSAVAAEGREGVRRALQFVGSGTNPLAAVAVAAQDEDLPRQAVRDFADREIKRLGLERGESAQFRDQNDIAQDEGMKPLREAYLSSTGRIEGEDPLRNFGAVFFPGSSFGTSTDLYAPQRLQATNFLYWREAERPAYTPTLAEVKAKVEEAWRLDKARALARAEADKLAEAGRKAGDAERTLKDASARFGNKIIELKGVAHLIPAGSGAPVPVMSQEAFHTYPKPKEIENPSPDWQKFVDEILDRLKNKSDTVVLTDQPQDVFYVAALVKESPEHPSRETLATFYQAYQSQSRALLTQLQEKDQFPKEYHQALLEGLRKEAGLQVNEDVIRGMDKSRGALDDR